MSNIKEYNNVEVVASLNISFRLDCSLREVLGEDNVDFESTDDFVEIVKDSLSDSIYEDLKYRVRNNSIDDVEFEVHIK